MTPSVWRKVSIGSKKIRFSKKKRTYQLLYYLKILNLACIAITFINSQFSKNTLTSLLLIVFT